MCFNCIIGNAKLIQHRFIKSYVFQLGRIGHSEKKIKVVAIEHKKQKLSLQVKTVLFSLCMHASLKGVSCLK